MVLTIIIFTSQAMVRTIMVYYTWIVRNLLPQSVKQRLRLTQLLRCNILVNIACIWYNYCCAIAGSLCLLKNLIQSLYTLYFCVCLVVVLLLLNLIKTEHNCGKTFPVIFLVCLVENLSVWIWIFVVFKTSLFYFAWSAAVFYPYRVGRFFLISHFGVPPFLHSFISHHSTTMKHGLSYWSILRVRDLGLGV